MDLLEGSQFQSKIEVMAYDLLLKVREAKKNGTIPQSRTEFESILAEIETLYVWAILSEDETKHINNWINSSKKTLGIKE